MQVVWYENDYLAALLPKYHPDCRVKFGEADVCHSTEYERRRNADNSEAIEDRNIGTTALYYDVSDEALRNAGGVGVRCFDGRFG